VLDKLQAMQTTTEADRPADTYQDNWGDRIKVEIPQTGVSIGEARQLLVAWLGHETHVSGEVIDTPTGIALTARMGSQPAQAFPGAKDDLDTLAQQAAEAIYRASQPYRYANYLEEHGRIPEAFQVISNLAVTGSASERAWAFAQWGFWDIADHGDVAAAIRHGERSLAFGGASSLDAEITIVNANVWAGHAEQNLRHSRNLYRLARLRSGAVTEDSFLENKMISSAYLAGLVGDERGSATQWLGASAFPATRSSPTSIRPWRRRASPSITTSQRREPR
jgi:hypothetical protein